MTEALHNSPGSRVDAAVGIALASSKLDGIPPYRLIYHFRVENRHHIPSSEAGNLNSRDEFQLSRSFAAEIRLFRKITLWNV
jgi:hypothetical protein